MFNALVPDDFFAVEDKKFYSVLILYNIFDALKEGKEEVKDELRILQRLTKERLDEVLQAN